MKPVLEVLRHQFQSLVSHRDNNTNDVDAWLLLLAPAIIPSIQPITELS